MPLPETNQREIALSMRLGVGGAEQIRPITVEATEGLSTHFEVVVEVVSLAEIELLPNLGKPAAVACSIDGEIVRHFHGILIDGQFLREETTGFFYRLRLAPAAWFHEQGSNFRIFQQKSVIEIVKQVLNGCGIDFAVEASIGTRLLPYCVQYGESDFAFVSRLLEEDGLFTYYRHAAGSHTLVISDDGSKHPDIPGESLSYNPAVASVTLADSQSRAFAEHGTYVTSWQEHASTGAQNTATQRDWNFLTPKPVTASDTATSAHEGDTIEVYQWPGRFLDNYQDDALNEAMAGKDTLSRVVLQARRSPRVRYDASSQYSGIQAGLRLTLKDHPTGRFNRRYLIVAARLRIANEQYRSGMDDTGTEITFTAIPDDVEFRAPQVTPRPVARGPETALVTGPPGEEIHVDEYGRIKVQFHWDREGHNDDTSSCWVRVSQFGLLGTIVHPRVGQEVIVDFINGNPDRPIVTGRVYNAAHMPHYKLPGDKTKALWRTKTYLQDSGSDQDGMALDSGQPGANELRFEDKPGGEEVYLHAERDMNTRIRAAETHHVGASQEIAIGGDRTEHVYGKETVTVDKDREVTIHGVDKLGVDQTLDIHATGQITIESDWGITLKVGDSKIEITPMSISIEAMMVDVHGTLNLQVRSVMTQVNGDAMLTAKGGVVMIN